jgi:hypothetical protein
MHHTTEILLGLLIVYVAAQVGAEIAPPVLKALL